VQLRVLLHAAEMDRLFESLSSFRLYVPGSLVPRGQGQIDPSVFLQVYREYCHALQGGVIPPEAHYRRLFSTLWTVSEEALNISPIGENEELIRPSRPVIQLRPHRFNYSHFDGQFRSMVLGGDSITWGIQFSYPHLVQDPTTQDIETVSETPQFPNTRLFRELQRWIRDNTIPTPFIVNGQRSNAPIRLGKNCMSWINHHPELREQAIRVHYST